jgi:hypothetical protein
MNTNCLPINCPCFCPTADTPVAPIMAPQGGPGSVFDVTLYGTLGFSVTIVSNPVFLPSGTPSIASVQIVSGNILRITTGSPGVADTIAGYDALISVSNACGSVDIPIRVDVVADLNPVITDCALAQLLWTPDARPPAPGDTLLAFTPAGCRALLPTDVCGELRANPTVLPTVNDTVFGQQAGACAQFTVQTLVALAATTFPLLAPNGSCAAPSYSFAASPDSGMFYTGTAVRISDDNCIDFIEVGASITLRTNSTFIRLQSGANVLTTAATTILESAGTTFTATAGTVAKLQAGLAFVLANAGDFVEIEASQVQIKGRTNNAFSSSIDIHGSDANLVNAGNATLRGGNAFGGVFNGGQVDVLGGSSNGGLAGRALLQGGNATGVGATPGIAVVWGGFNNAPGLAGDAYIVGGLGGGSVASSGDVVIASGDPLNFVTNRLERLRVVGPTGAWQIGGNPGAAGEVITSQGAGLPVGWAAPVTSFPLLAPDGSCAAPSYSFTSSPDSGMWYDAGLGAVIISDDNCGDQIQIGASINVLGKSSASPSMVTINAGSNTAPSGNGASVLITGGAGTGGGPFFSGGNVYAKGGNYPGGGQCGQFIGEGGDSSGGVGGTAILRGGLGGSAGGGAFVIGGSGNAAGAAGGNVGLTGGQANPGGGPAQGGGATLLGSPGAAGGGGGNVTITGGGGAGVATALGGTVRITSGTGSPACGDVVISGADTATSPSTAGHVFISGGRANNAFTDVPGDVRIDGGTGDVTTGGGDVIVRTGFVTVERVRWRTNGEWQLAGNPGVAGQVLTSNGPGVPPSWI